MNAKKFSAIVILSFFTTLIIADFYYGFTHFDLMSLENVTASQACLMMPFGLMLGFTIILGVFALVVSIVFLIKWCLKQIKN